MPLAALPILSREKLRGEREGGEGGDAGREPRRNDVQRGRSVVGRSIGRLLVGAVKSVARGMFYVGQLDVPTAFPLLYALKPIEAYSKCGYDFTPIKSFANGWRSGLPRAKAMVKQWQTVYKALTVFDYRSPEERHVNLILFG